MRILGFKLETSWFGLRKQLFVHLDPQHEGEEDYWAPATIERLERLVEVNAALSSEVQRLRMQLNSAKRAVPTDNDRRTLQMTLAEIAEVVGSQVNLALEKNQLLARLDAERRETAEIQQVLSMHVSGRKVDGKTISDGMATAFAKGGLVGGENFSYVGELSLLDSCKSRFADSPAEPFSFPSADEIRPGSSGPSGSEISPGSPSSND